MAASASVTLSIVRDRLRTVEAQIRDAAVKDVLASREVVTEILDRLRSATALIEAREIFISREQKRG